MSESNSEWIATTWTKRRQYEAYDPWAISIQRTNSPFYEGERFAVRRIGDCLSKDGQWEYEPTPSSRDDAFYARCRFDTFEDAVAALKKANGEG